MNSLLILALIFAAPAFSYAEGSVTSEARKLDTKAKKKINKAKKDVQEELCDSGQEQCTVNGKEVKPTKTEPAH